jgi:hypothetical protein
MLLLWITSATCGDLMFQEDWTGGTGRWQAPDGQIQLIDAPDDEGMPRRWQHETMPASGGRVRLITPIPVTGGAAWCLSARVHATAGAGAFLGFDSQLSAGPPVEHWMIGMAGNGNGFGGLTVPVTEGAWSRYEAPFVTETNAVSIVLKDELWVGGAAGAADFTDIRVFAGSCGEGADTDTPVDTPDPPDTPDLPDTDTPTGVPVRGDTIAGYGPERERGCGGHGAGMAALLLVGRRRRLAAAAALTLSACHPATRDAALDDLGVRLGGPLLVDPERPTSGEDVQVTIDVPPDAGWTLTATGRGCGTIAGQSGVGGAVIDGLAAHAGVCAVRAEVRPATDEPWTISRRFLVQSSDPDVPPIDVVGGIWRPVLPGVRGAAEAPVVTAIDGATSFINGATIDLDVDVDVEGALAALVVTVDGWEGGFIVPLPDEADLTARSLWGDNQLRVRVPARYFDEASEAALSLGIAGLDRQDRLGEAVGAVLDGREVGTGDVQVGLSWSSATDVDLHVIEPTGAEISYAAPSSAAGGQLDLDSNAGCSIDGINHENIYWPSGSAPSGTYTVTAVLYSGCEVGGASGSVTMTWCGEGSPRVETFSLSEGSPTASWTFDSTCGQGKRASGLIRYEDRSAGARGYGPPAFLPARHVTVRLIRESDAEVLATGVTDSGGRYDLGFSNDGAPGFRVEVQARADDDDLRLQVTTLDEELYVWQTEQVFDDSAQQTFEGVDLDLPASANGDVLSMYDVARRAIEVARLGTSRRPDPLLTIAYTRGTRPNRSNSSEYSPFWRTINVAGDADDPDVYDDWTIAHEMGHFIIDTLGASNSSGGEHNLDDYTAPPLAWDEGFATWFATQVMEGSVYIDLKISGGGSVWDIDTLQPEIPLGNLGDRLEGGLSEALVASVLLDISDDLDEPKDTINGRDPSIWWVFRHRLREPKSDRGASGRDLVDFLDAWMCGDLGDVGGSDGDGLRGIVSGLHRLSYDFSPTCR